jgi:hypothetical protein
VLQAARSTFAFSRITSVDTRSEIAGSGPAEVANVITQCRRAGKRRTSTALHPHPNHTQPTTTRSHLSASARGVVCTLDGFSSEREREHYTQLRVTKKEKEDGVRS